MKKHLEKQKGSALIIALLIMGVLITLALGLSDLVIREVKITTDIISSGKAFYAAESGVEKAMLDLKENVEGYEKDFIFGAPEQVGLSERTELNYGYSIGNRTKVLPYLDTEVVSPFIAQNDPGRYLYDSLKLNESVVIPLFTSDGPVTEFRVEYYIQGTISPEWEETFTAGQVDVLRWKLTGIKRIAGSGVLPLITESIGDYIASIYRDPQNPTCFGNNFSNVPNVSFTDGIDYTASQGCAVFVDKAREAYLVTYDTVNNTYETDPFTNQGAFIEDFMDNHDNIYLTISNIFNPNILSNPDQSKIYYRVIVPRDDEWIARDFAKISSTGKYRKLRQTVEAFVAPNRFLPVFNFSLYRTDTDSDKEDPYGYGN